MPAYDMARIRALVTVRLAYSVVARRTAAESEEAVAVHARSHLIDAVDDDPVWVVRQSNNELIVCFDDALSGLNATRAMQQVAAVELAPRGVKIRIGLVRSIDGFAEGDWQQALTKSRELARLAASSQTLACLPLASDLDGSAHKHLSTMDSQNWPDEVCKHDEQVYCVVWQDDVPTRIVLTAGEGKQVTRVSELRLAWRDEQFVLTETSGRVTFGRGTNADITIDSTFASRAHAHVEYSDTCFVLTDHSTNGTYVQIDGSEVFVHDDKVILRDEGWISLGRRPPSSKGLVVYFWAYADSSSNHNEKTWI